MQVFAETLNQTKRPAALKRGGSKSLSRRSGTVSWTIRSHRRAGRGESQESHMTANEKHLKGVAERFSKFHSEFARFFQTRTRDSSEIAGQYLSGLVQAPRKNMERMEEKVPESNEQALQHFVTNSPWDESAVLKQVATEGDKLLGGQEDSCLLIDETSFVKKGKKSVGVARQYCGRSGKIDNCQVAVFGALVAGDKSLPIDFRLYLPQEWTGDMRRCLSAGIPEDKIEQKSKCQLAIEIVKAAQDNNVRFNWVGADAGYGKDPGFLGDLFDLGRWFVADVQKNQLIYFTDPTRHLGVQGLTVEKWVEQQHKALWKPVTVRQSTKGELVFDYLHTTVWIKSSHERTFRVVHLIVRRNVGTKDDLKFSVANAPEIITLEKLAYMQGQRFWIERAFEDSKGSLGMADYQLRKWRGWHHHMALTLLAHLFLLRERFENAEGFPLLSCKDVVTMLAYYLPKRDVSEEEIFRQMKARHRKRQDVTLRPLSGCLVCLADKGQSLCAVIQRSFNAAIQPRCFVRKLSVKKIVVASKTPLMLCPNCRCSSGRLSYSMGYKANLYAQWKAQPKLPSLVTTHAPRLSALWYRKTRRNWQHGAQTVLTVCQICSSRARATRGETRQTGTTQSRITSPMKTRAAKILPKQKRRFLTSNTTAANGEQECKSSTT